MDRLRIQRYVHNRPKLQEGELEWRQTRTLLASYALYINSLLYRASRIDGGIIYEWGYEVDDAYEILRTDPSTDRLVERYRMDFGDVFKLSPFGVYSVSPRFMELRMFSPLKSVFKEDHDDVLLFNPVCGEGRWYALYLDIDDLRASSSELLSGIDIEGEGNRLRSFLRPRCESRLWRRIVEKYRGDDELLRFIYYDTLWYHTGRGIHIVCYDRWSRHIFNSPREDWLELVGCTRQEWIAREKERLRQRDIDSEIAALRARLRSDPDQYIGPNMKVRLAGSTNPRTGDIALGFLHPYALPYYEPFSEDKTGAEFGRWGILPFGYHEMRAQLPLPEPCGDDGDEGADDTSGEEGRRFVATSPINSALAGESLYLLQVRWGRKTRRIITDLDKREVGKFIVQHRLNLREILLEEGVDALDGRKVIDLNRYARMTAKFLQPVETRSEVKIVTLWKWELEFDAAPFGISTADRLGLSDCLKVSDGRARIEDVYTLELPSFVAGGRFKYSRDFRSFRVHLYRVDIPETSAAGLRVVSAKDMEVGLGVHEMIELEWGVLSHLRSSNRVSDFLAFIWLHHLKRMRYHEGIVPRDGALEYLMSELGWSGSHTRSRLKRLERLGWVIPVRKGYIVHSWVRVATLLGVSCERVVLVNKDEVRSIKGLKCVAASLPGTFGEPLIKFEIARKLGVSVHTVKRNRRGRLREWYSVCYMKEYRTQQQAEQARVTELHPKHGWPLCLCGYRSAPARLSDDRWILERSSAARILDLTCVSLAGKSRRLRRATSNLTTKGGGVSESSVVTWRMLDGSERCTNFSDTFGSKVQVEMKVGSAFRPLKRSRYVPALSPSTGGVLSSLSGGRDACVYA